jgi:DNA modification methylase
MKPYYEEASITIYHGDCREVLPELGRFDLLLTDPPYGIGVSRKAFGSGRIKGGGFLSRGGANYAPKQFVESGWDDNPADDELIALARSVADMQIIWGGNYFNLPPSMRWLVWDKKNDGTDFADCELAWTNIDKAVRIFRHRWNGMLQENGGRLKEQRLHPTMKPLNLMKWCITQVPHAVCSLVDAFMGSGTSLVAAKDLGILATGIELEERYCEIAANRLRQSVLNFEGVA